MTPVERAGSSAAQKTDICCRWKAGQSLHRMGRACAKPHTSIHCLLTHHRGIVSPTRRGSLLALRVGEREEISRGIACGSSIREIAKRGRIQARFWPPAAELDQPPSLLFRVASYDQGGRKYLGGRYGNGQSLVRNPEDAFLERDNEELEGVFIDLELERLDQSPVGAD
jgi:hypothetical protein